jgi:hypothetical protein
MKFWIVAFQAVTSYNLISNDQHFRGTVCLHILGRNSTMEAAGYFK